VNLNLGDRDWMGIEIEGWMGTAVLEDGNKKYYWTLGIGGWMSGRRGLRLRLTTRGKWDDSTRQGKETLCYAIPDGIGMDLGYARPRTG
jgi:hypothetical protein